MASNSNIGRTRSSKLTLKSDKNLSHAEIPKVAKRRGLYVERKRTSKENCIKSKSPPRPDKSNFLYAALNMLSKPSAGTQFPEEKKTLQKCPIPDPNKVRRLRNPVKMKVRKDYEQNQSQIPKDVKKKFRSKILSSINNYESQEQVTVIKSKKDFVQTPTVSNVEVTKADIDLQCDVKEGVNTKLDKGIYDFFDEVNNTYSVYNVSIEEDDLKQSSSVVKFTKIDDAVAKNLEIKQSEVEIDSTILQKDSYYVKDEETPIATSKRKSKPKLKNKQTEKIKENSKKKLLNILRQQLSQTQEVYEPPNLYQALKQIAKNNRKSIRFESVDNNPSCKYKKRNLLNAKEVKRVDEPKKYPTKARPMKNLKISPSDHSLKVYGFEEKIPKEKRDKYVFLTYHSSDEFKNLEFNPNEVILKYSDNSMRID